MTPFKSHQGLLATLDRANVDTDQIIPKQFLKAIGRTGFGTHLFQDWRYLTDGTPNPNFELNQPRFNGASILVTRNNFGCGSSREHAVWAVAEYGFRAVVAPRLDAASPAAGGTPSPAGIELARSRDGSVVPAFADIFRSNCVKNGVLTIELREAEVEEIFQMVGRYKGLEATIDLDRQRLVLHLPEELAFHFDIDPAVKTRLIHGLDDIGLTLQHEAAIRTFESRHNVQR